MTLSVGSTSSDNLAGTIHRSVMLMVEGATKAAPTELSSATGSFFFDLASLKFTVKPRKKTRRRASTPLSLRNVINLVRSLFLSQLVKKGFSLSGATTWRDDEEIWEGRGGLDVDIRFHC